jgi:hypothetical protein
VRAVCGRRRWRWRPWRHGVAAGARLTGARGAWTPALAQVFRAGDDGDNGPTRWPARDVPCLVRSRRGASARPDQHASQRRGSISALTFCGASATAQTHPLPPTESLLGSPPRRFVRATSMASAQTSSESSGCATQPAVTGAENETCAESSGDERGRCGCRSRRSGPGAVLAKGRDASRAADRRCRT